MQRVWCVNLIELSFFLIDNFFFNLIFQHWVDRQLYFMIYFGLFFMRLSQFYDSSREFGGLTQLTRVFFFIFFNWYFFQFYLSTLSWLWIRLHDLFGLFSMRLSRFYELGSHVLQVNSCRQRSFYCILFLCLFFPFNFNL